MMLVPKLWSRDEQGAFLERIAAQILSSMRWETKERVRFTGMEVDILADHRDTKERCLVQCKFVRDPISANVIDLLVGQASRKGASHAFILATADAGKEASGVLDDIAKADNLVNNIRVAFYGPEQLLEILLAGKPAPRVLARSAASLSLVVSPTEPPFWALEVSQGTKPLRAEVWSAEEDEQLDLGRARQLLEDNGVFPGLEIALRGDASVVPAEAEPSAESPIEETVSPVPVADSIDDYRPCRPIDFVGRSELQKEMLRYLELVRLRNTKTRVLSLSGPSGFGKSSVVLKLAHRVRNKKWCRKFFMSPVDTRAARRTGFVQAALRAAVEAAAAEGFLDLPKESFALPSAGPLLRNPYMRAALTSLEVRKRVLVLFFDQFEEVFTKDELRGVYESFRHFANEVAEAQGPLVVGFSWRTGLNLSDDNPAYHTWHSLSDSRRNFELGPFSSSEANALIGQFSTESGTSFIAPLRRRLADQAQGLPWLLKKLTIHIFREIRRDVDQLELISRRLNVAALFNDDVVSLSAKETECLRFIAKRSPVDVQEVVERFSVQIGNGLYDRRLVVKTGYRYAIYWDIFKEFLNDGVIPPIPWRYVPKVPVSMTMQAFSVLREAGALSLAELAVRSGYIEGTAANIATDLQNLPLAQQRADGKLVVIEEAGTGVDAVAEFLTKQFREHVVVAALFQKFPQASVFNRDEVRVVVREIYSASSRNAKTLDGYAQRLLAWCRFVGLLEHESGQLRRPVSRGREFGLMLDTRRSGTVGFVGSSGPEQVVEAAWLLRKEGKARIARNVAQDLMQLGLAYPDGSWHFPSRGLARAKGRSAVRMLVLGHAQQSTFMRAYGAVSSPDLSVKELGLKLGEVLERKWSEGSALRYGSAARRWASEISAGT